MPGFSRRRGGVGAPPRGLFVDGGVWHCNCTPRQPANHFEVKKPGPNQGKWFRTYQRQQDDKSRCKFFLWDSDAHPREATALAHNSRTEPSAVSPQTPSKRPVAPLPVHAIEPKNGDLSRKRGRATSVDLSDEYGLETNQDFRNELEDTMTAIETPRKAARVTDVTTPLSNRELPWSKDDRIAANPHGLQTPRTDHAIRTNPSYPDLGRSLLAPSHPLRFPSLNETPTPNRFRDVERDDLIQDIGAVLQDAGIRLGAATEANLQALVSKHTRASEGLRRGRDVARSTIKARDAKIVELNYRISALEAEVEAEKALVKHLRWKAEAADRASP